MPDDPQARAYQLALVEWSQNVDVLLEKHFTSKPLPILPGSSLAGDDELTWPYLMSNEIRQALGIAIDNLDCASSL